MSPQELEIGTAYYRVTYADNELTIPGVEPMIYVGTNVFPDDVASDVVYYFPGAVPLRTRRTMSGIARLSPLCSRIRKPKSNVKFLRSLK
jgi:hypothetical protein